MLKGEACACSGADREAKTQTAPGSGNQIVQHTSNAAQSGGALRASGCSFGEPDLPMLTSGVLKWYWVPVPPVSVQ